MAVDGTRWTTRCVQIGDTGKGRMRTELKTIERLPAGLGDAGAEEARHAAWVAALTVGKARPGVRNAGVAPRIAVATLPNAVVSPRNAGARA